MMVEADSTTSDLEEECNSEIDGPRLPFTISECNYKFYVCNIQNMSKGYEFELIKWLQHFGMIPSVMQCPAKDCEYNMICKTTRVVDRVQWLCQQCNVKLPIRYGTFFAKLPCSIYQVLQLVLAWCEDADCEVAAEHFGVKPQLANTIFTRLDDLAIQETCNQKLGGENCVVLCEMYPDCVTRQSPDTTEQSHTHQVLMLADSEHIPTRYRLHVIKSDIRSGKNHSINNEVLQSEIQRILSKNSAEGSLVVYGHNLNGVQGVPLSHLIQHCDNDMQYFLCSRIWRQAITLCSASRDMCAGLESMTKCTMAMQKYLDVSLYRLQQKEHFYERMLRLIAQNV